MTSDAGGRNPDVLDETRVLVVGGSTGAGRGIGEVLAQRGARVAFAARRREKVDAVAARLGNGAIGLQCDVCDEDSCIDVVDRAVAAFGGLDAVLYAPAIVATSMLLDADAAYWEQVFRTNVVGAALVTRAAVPHLGADRGRVLYLSSASASGPAWPGLGVYAASKAALERMVDCWREEHPEVLFTVLSLGPIGSSREADEIPEYALTEQAMRVFTTQMKTWTERRLVPPELPDSTIAEHVVAILRSSADVARITIQAPW